MIFGTRKVESLGYRMVKKIAEKFNRLSRVHQRHRQQTDGIAMASSDREREFTSAKNQSDGELHRVLNERICMLCKQGVALTARNTTGPPRAAPW